MKLEILRRARGAARSAWLAGMCAAGLAALPVPAKAAPRVPAAAAARASDLSDWLGEINTYRLAAGLAPVSASAQWDTGLEHHLSYLLHTPRGLISGLYASLHTENPLSPYYTPDGASEGASSDLALGGANTPVQAIQRWLAAPFHAIGMLRAQLTQVGLALEGGDAALDVIHGLDPSRPRPRHPILFPGRGMTTNLAAYMGETPSPLESCSWQGVAGLPLIVMLPSAPSAGLSATLKGPGGSRSSGRGSLCVVDERTYRSSDTVYGPTGGEILAADHAVLLIPRGRLADGRYSATVRQPRSKPINWSFSVNTRAAGAKR